MLDLDKQELFLWSAFIENMTNHLLSLQNSISTPLHVGKNWVSNLIKYCTELQCCYFRCYNHEQAKCENIRVIQNWFKTLRNTITEHEILTEDIYNFNETEFVMRLCAIIKIITSVEHYSQIKLLQSENHKWITVIKLINISDWALSSYIILKSQNLQKDWFDKLLDN